MARGAAEPSAAPQALQPAVGEEQRRLYQWAMAQAVAVVRPSILERFQANGQN